MLSYRRLLLLGMILLCLVLRPACYARQAAGTVDQAVDVVEVLKATATVEKIDLEHRKATLLLDNGKKKTYKVDKGVQNLDQVKVGDHLKISYTEEIIILVGKSNETPGAAAVGEVGVAPKGTKPGIVMVETTAVSAKIVSVDSEKHRVTLLDSDGKEKTVKVGKKVTNLDQFKAGESIDMVMTDSLLIEVVK